MQFKGTDVDCLDNVGIRRIHNAREAGAPLIERNRLARIRVAIEIERIRGDDSIVARFYCGTAGQQRVRLSWTTIVGQCSKQSVDWQGQCANLIAINATRKAVASVRLANQVIAKGREETTCV